VKDLEKKVKESNQDHLRVNLSSWYIRRDNEFPKLEKMKIKLLITTLFISANTFSQRNVTNANDSNTPLHLLQPDYPVPYGIPKVEDVKSSLNRIYEYLNSVTPAAFVDSKTGEEITDLSKINATTALKKGDYRIVSYEWGVTYAALLAAAKATGDDKYKKYTIDRLKFISNAAPYFKKTSEEHADWATAGPLRGLIAPKALDDCGAMCTAILKTKMAGESLDAQLLIDTHIDYIMKKEHRLKDGTLARMRPQADALWLDDMFMGVPAIANLGKFTGEKKYFDEAVKQIQLFHSKMFNKEKGVYMHGWIQSMSEHPQFHWARANGWGILTKIEVLDVLPENHPGRPIILKMLKDHIRGLAKYQSGSGFWHQLLDKEDSYLETSATAIYTYCIAHAINKGWIDKMAYSPMVMLGWNAVSTKINERGQVEGTCVGTGMGFDPAFYYHRPVSPFAAHGYGPTIYAASEIINLLNNNKFEINDSSVQLKK
jgi:unsaturated rhamnogalacturonyl hydrolase